MPISSSSQEPAADRISVGGRDYRIHSIAAVDGAARLPYSLKILLENLVRTRDDRVVTAGADGRIALWSVGRQQPDAVFEGHSAPIAALAVGLAPQLAEAAAVERAISSVRTIRADRRVEGVDPGIARCTGQITVRFENTTLLAQAQAGTSAEFAMAFTIDANRSLTITLHEVYLALAKTPIEGPAASEVATTVVLKPRPRPSMLRG